MADQSMSGQPKDRRARGLRTRVLVSHHTQHTSLYCASNDSHSARALMVSLYPVALTAGFDQKSKPADGRR